MNDSRVGPLDASDDAVLSDSGPDAGPIESCDVFSDVLVDMRELEGIKNCSAPKGGTIPCHPDVTLTALLSDGFSGDPPSRVRVTYWFDDGPYSSLFGIFHLVPSAGRTYDIEEAGFIDFRASITDDFALDARPEDAVYVRLWFELDDTPYEGVFWFELTEERLIQDRARRLPLTWFETLEVHPDHSFVARPSTSFQTAVTEERMAAPQTLRLNKISPSRCSGTPLEYDEDIRAYRASLSSPWGAGTVRVLIGEPRMRSREFMFESADIPSSGSPLVVRGIEDIDRQAALRSTCGLSAFPFDVSASSPDRPEARTPMCP